MPTARRTPAAPVLYEITTDDIEKRALLGEFAAAAQRWTAAGETTTRPNPPPQAAQTTPHDLATLVSQGYDVRAHVKRHVDDGWSISQQVWGERFIDALSQEWLRLLGRVSEPELADRWVCATATLNNVVVAQGLDLLAQRVDDLKAILAEKDTLLAVANDAQTEANTPETTRSRTRL